MTIRTFSMFPGRPGIHPSVHQTRIPPERPGKSLPEELARIACERGYGRPGWDVLTGIAPGSIFVSRSAGTVVRQDDLPLSAGISEPGR